MAHELATEFRRRLHQAGERIREITPEQAEAPFCEGGWLRKELVGHLLDSAANNQVRFVVAALAAPCRLGDAPPVSLEFLILDYLDHLDHHVKALQLAEERR